jgi:glycosyltransferase involved in cell wall biosynthesis
MRLMFVADGRSPTALNWIAHFVKAGHEVHLISTALCAPDLDLASFQMIPVAFSGMRKKPELGRGGFGDARMIPIRAFLRHWLGPITIPGASRATREAINSVEPDLVHAMRIPFEGMMTATADPSFPLLLSVWGNDFTLHAGATPVMGMLTRRSLMRADALHVDCARDLKLAYARGFSRSRLNIILPGGGGVRPDVFHTGEPDPDVLGNHLADVMLGISTGAQVVVNPRGFRAYVRNDTFFRAIPKILEVKPNTIFLCPAMAGEREAERWIDRLKIGAEVHLLPRLTPIEMAAVYQLSSVTVSITEHDGTPNTLLEAMACGCFPVAGDLESIGEWIEDGANGLLVEPGDPSALALAVIRALSDPDIRARSAERNDRLITERAISVDVMRKAEEFYQRLTNGQKK